MSNHYRVNPIETIQFIVQVVKDYPPAVAFHIGSAIKYIARAPHKGSYEKDLYKAEDFLHHARTGKWLHEEEQNDKESV